MVVHAVAGFFVLRREVAAKSWAAELGPVSRGPARKAVEKGGKREARRPHNSGPESISKHVQLTSATTAFVDD